MVIIQASKCFYPLIDHAMTKQEKILNAISKGLMVLRITMLLQKL